MKRRSVMASRYNEERRQKRMQLIIGIVIVLLMVVSVFSVMLYQDTGTGEDLDGFTQVYDGQLYWWVTDVNGQEVRFLYHPSALETIPATFNTAILAQPQIGLAFDPDQEGLDLIDSARLTLSEDLAKQGVATQTYVVANTSLYTFPIINCSSDVGIIMQYANQTKITEQQQCVVVQGETPEEFYQAFERLRHIIYGFT